MGHIKSLTQGSAKCITWRGELVVVSTSSSEELGDNLMIHERPTFEGQTWNCVLTSMIYFPDTTFLLTRKFGRDQYKSSDGRARWSWLFVKTCQTQNTRKRFISAGVSSHLVRPGARTSVIFPRKMMEILTNHGLGHLQWDTGSFVCLSNLRTFLWSMSPK